MYHSYSMQVHGYVCSSTTGDSGSFTLVHGVGCFLSKSIYIAALVVNLFC